MAQLPKYKQLISEFVRQQMVVMGPDLAVSIANRVNGLEVDHKGAVIVMNGDPTLVLRSLMSEFLKLSPALSPYFVSSIFAKYPDVAEEYGQPIPKINFVCALIKPKA